MKAVELRRFQPLRHDSEEDKSVGWCVPGNGLDLELVREKVFFDSHLALGFRVDQWRLPRALLRARLEEAATAHRERTGRERLSKKEKEELAFRVTRKLRREVLPSMKACDVCWDLDRGTVLLWNRSRATKEDFQALFEKTFQLGLDETSPFVEAHRVLQLDAQDEFHPPEQSSFLVEAG